MKSPTDNELETMAVRLESHSIIEIRNKAAALLRACKGRDITDAAQLIAEAERRAPWTEDTFYKRVAEALRKIHRSTTLRPLPAALEDKKVRAEAAEAKLKEAVEVATRLADWIEHEAGCELPFDARAALRDMEGGE